MLRTEPNVRFAAIFGSVARGDESDASDLDMVVDFDKRDRRGRIRLANKVEAASERRAQLLHLRDVELCAPDLLGEVLVEGRVLIDRDDHWPGLMRRRRQILERAREAGENSSRPSGQRSPDSNERRPLADGRRGRRAKFRVGPTTRELGRWERLAAYGALPGELVEPMRRLIGQRNIFQREYDTLGPDAGVDVFDAAKEFSRLLPKAILPIRSWVDTSESDPART